MEVGRWFEEDKAFFGYACERKILENYLTEFCLLISSI